MTWYVFSERHLLTRKFFLLFWNNEILYYHESSTLRNSNVVQYNRHWRGSYSLEWGDCYETISTQYFAVPLILISSLDTQHYAIFATVCFVHILINANAENSNVHWPSSSLSLLYAYTYYNFIFIRKVQLHFAHSLLGDFCVLWGIINILLTSLFSLRFYYCCKPKKTLIYEWIAGFAGFVDVFLFIRFYTTYILCVLWVQVVPRVFKTSRHFSYIRSLHAVYDVLCVCSLFFV